MRTFTAFLVCVVLAVTCACSNPKALRFKDKESIPTVMDKIKNSKSLTVEEVQLLQGYLMRYTMAEGFKGFTGKNELPLDGKTVGELIDLQRKWVADTNAEEEKQTKLAEEARLKKAAIASELKRIITLSVYDKGFSEREYQSYLTISLTYQNNSAKDIRAFQGGVIFRDLFGDKVQKIGLKITDPIAAGAKGEWNGRTSFNQFMDEDVKFKNAELKDLKVEWVPEKIIFSDGTTIPEGAQAGD